MSYVHHRVIAGIGEAAQKLARIGITLAPLEKATEPARHAALNSKEHQGRSFLLIACRKASFMRVW
jgi:hypothetical protein